jgi:hypothetical protein
MNYFKSVLVFLLVILLTSCQKEEANLFPEYAEPSEAKAGDLELRHLYGWLDCDPLLGGCIYYPFGCAWPSHNCLPTIVIRGSAEESDLEDLVNHIHNGTYHKYFSGSDYQSTFGVVDSFPNFLSLLKNRSVDFEIRRSDTLNHDLFLIGFDKNVLSSERKEEDILVVFKIDD